MRGLKRKAITYFLLFFGLPLSILGIGFSSWLLENEVLKVDVTATTGDVVNISNFLNFKKFTTFYYCKAGFIKDEIISYQTELCAEIDIDFNSMSEKLEDYQVNEFELDLDLYQNSTSDSFNFINAITSFQATIHPNSIGLNYTNGLSNNIYSVQLTFSNLAELNETIKLYCSFNIDVSNYLSNSSFENEIYGKALNKNTVFVLRGGFKNVK